MRIILFLTILMAGQSLTQGSWRYPVSIKDFYITINAIRTEPGRFTARVKSIFEDLRNGANLHSQFGETYSDLMINNFKTFLSTTNGVGALELDRGLSIVGWRHAQHLSSINNVGNGVGPNGLNL